MKSIKVLFLTFTIIAGFTACKNEAKTNKNSSAPSISYDMDTIKTQFMENGMSSMPKIDWGGEVGKVLLNSNSDGLSVNDSTGLVYWSTTLPKGGHEFTVVVKNTNGSGSVNMFIENKLSGTFTGTYQWNGKSYFYEMYFAPDGSMNVSSDSPRSRNSGSGTWIIDSLNRLVVNYKYPSGEEASTVGKIIATDGKITYKGVWFNGFEALPENKGEGFELVFKS